MALTYNRVDYRGKAAEPLVAELIFENDTIGKGLVTLEEDIKAETIFTESTATATIQAYTVGVPSSAGALNVFDFAVTPTKVQFYHEFDPNTLRFSRFKRDMKAGAWEILSDEFERVVIGGIYAKKQSYALEYEFWNGVTSAQKTAIAGLTAGAPNTSIGAAEQTLTAAKTAGQFNGVVSMMMYNASNQAGSSAVGGRIKVAGTTITSANIKAEYDKLYIASPSQTIALADNEEVFIYAPKSHKQLINVANNQVTNYINPFSVNNGVYYFNDIEIKFVPLTENTVVLAPKSHLMWCTDLASDVNNIKVDVIAANREDMFIKSNMTIAAHVVNQAWNVLYVG